MSIQLMKDGSRIDSMMFCCHESGINDGPRNKRNRMYNAYMLVYVKESEINRVLTHRTPNEVRRGYMCMHACSKYVSMHAAYFKVEK